MTSAVNNNNDGVSNVSGDKNNLPYQNGTLTWKNGDTISEVIGLRSFRGIGAALPPITALAGATALKLMCATKKAGQYVQIGDDIVLDATAWISFMSTEVAFWNFAYFEIVGTLTGAGVMEYNRT